MTLTVQTDSDGHEFNVWAQRQANSCAVASIWMARGMARQMTFDEGEWDLAWRTYNNAVAGGTWRTPYADPGPAPAPQTFDHTQYDAGHHAFANTFASTGIGGDHIASMLMQEGFAVNRVVNTGGLMPVKFANLAPTKPAIVGVGWFVQNPAGAWERRGGHAIVAARKTSSGQIVLLDPAGGRLVECANNGRYGGNGLIVEVLYIS